MFWHGICTKKLELNKSNLQLTEFLAKLPGIGADPADGVLAEVEVLQHKQAIQPASTNLCEIVMIQQP